jgi:excisionase family DNA binding protein
MELEDYMTAREFALLVNTPYPTVAQWLRDGRVPGAELQTIGSLKVWLIPRDALKDFKRPDMGRPKKETAKTAAKKSKKGAK